MLGVCFLAISIPAETAYSWRHIDAYYWVKVVGWALLATGIVRARGARNVSVVFAGAGWAWMAANFWRAVADRLRTEHAGGTLRLGTLEMTFAATCLAVCIAGLIWTLALANRFRGAP